MIRTLLFRHLRDHARLLLATAVGLGLFEALLVWVAARIEMSAGVRTFIETILPEDVRAAVSPQLGLVSFESAVAFGFQHPFALVAAVALIVAVATIGAAERESTFLDFVLARPVPRWRYLAAILLMIVVSSLVLPLAQLGGAAAGLVLVRANSPPADVPAWSDYLASAAALSCLLLAIGGYSLAFAARARRRGSAIAPAVGLTLLFYWIDFLGGFWDSLRRVRQVSLFQFFKPVEAARSGLAPADAAVLLLAATFTSAIAFLVFRRQDL